MKDITDELNERLAAVENEIKEIAAKRQSLDTQERDAQQRIDAVRAMLDWELRRQGRTNGASRWTGLGVSDAVQAVVSEHPDWSHSEIRDYLIAERFDFKGKKPGLSVNQALMRMRRGATGHA